MANRRGDLKLKLLNSEDQQEKERPIKQKEEEGRAGTGLSADPEILGAALARASVGLISAISPAGLPGQACDWRRNTGRLVAPTSQPSRLPREGLGLRFLQPPLICCLGKVGRASCLAEVV